MYGKINVVSNLAIREWFSLLFVTWDRFSTVSIVERLMGFLFKAPMFLLGKKWDNCFSSFFFNICSFHTRHLWLKFSCIKMLNKKNLYMCVSFKLFNYYDWFLLLLPGFFCLFRSPSLAWAVKLWFCENKSEFLIISTTEVLGKAKHRLHNHAVWLFILDLIGEIL